MDPLIKIKDLKVLYNIGEENEFAALDGVNIEIFPEEYIIFFGPSGSGKSTMLYSILGLQAPSQGEVIIKGRDSSKFSEEEKSNVSSIFFGVIFQNFNLIYSLNVMDNIILPQVFIDISKNERMENGMKLLKRFGIENRTNSPVSTLSGGQQQRVAICRALINNPEVVLADEPVGNLDSESAQVVMETLKEINKRDKKTVILVTHDMRYLHYADRVYYFKDAKLERVVSNTPGAEGSSQISPEAPLERLAHAYNFMNVAELKAWSITNYLADELTTLQTERLEVSMADLLTGKISEHQFFEILNTPLSQGGVGLYSSTAAKYSLRVSEILKEVNALKNIKDANHRKRREAVRVLRRFLLSEYTSALNRGQVLRIDKILAERMKNAVKMKEVFEFLSKPMEHGGVGLKSLTAERLSEKLEIILAQLQ